MSTTVTYKGSPLLNIDNDSKTLYTQGKYLEGDIMLSDVSEHLNLQTDKSVSYTPTTSQQTGTVYPDIGYDGMTSIAVTVGAVATGSATTPATTITANPSISVSSGGLITATASASQNVTPTVSAGYVSSGTAGTITVSGSNTSQLTTQGATTYTPTTSDQTIASGKYLTGAQTILGDQNLLAENIKKDVVLFGVTGSYEGGGGSVTTRKLIDGMGQLGVVSWIDGDGNAHSAAEVDMDIGQAYIEPQVGSLVTSWSNLGRYSSAYLQVVNSSNNLKPMGYITTWLVL